MIDSLTIRRSYFRPGFALTMLPVMIFFLGTVVAQERSSEPQAANSSSAQQKKETTGSSKNGRYNFGAELAKETREAAGEDDTAEFKNSPSIRLLARITGMTLQHAYWLAVSLNFAVIAIVIFWAWRKFLPGMFRERTLAIQRAMEEARKASAEANRRLSEIEARLSRLGVEIGDMQAAAEKEAAAEEARIIASIEEEAFKIEESARQEIAAAAKQARRELTAYAAGLAVSMAQKQIRVDTATDHALVRNFAEQLPITNPNGADPEKGTN